MPQKPFHKSIIKVASSETDIIIDKLFEDGFEYYQNAIATNILDSYYRTVYKIQSNSISESVPNQLPNSIFEEYLNKYNLAKTKFKQDIASDNSNIVKLVSKLIGYIDDIIYQASLDAQKLAYESEKITHYRYYSIIDGTTCEQCAELDGQVIPMKELQVGINYPKLHANCRCETDINIEYNVNEQGYFNHLKNYEKTSSDESNPFKTLFEAYFGQYQTVEINGEKYRVDLNNFQGIVVLPDGNLINANDVDKKLLELMKLRDNTFDFNEIQKIIKQAMDLMLNNQNNFSIDFFKPYSYYTLTENITAKLNNLMQGFEEKYKDKISNISWLLNLKNFYNLVKNGGELDLKNQKEWQQSAFIYNGEIVDGDAIGNITYGYLGKLMGIPDVVLQAGAGYAQVSAGTSNSNFILSFGDDPRDQVRILQGIQIYNKEHPMENLPLVMS